eukprot:m.287565 g.287565  ORF g.287565 m.287565 type:complete len:528 (+) comp19445_c0_seq4:1886-3469(+)
MKRAASPDAAGDNDLLVHAGALLNTDVFGANITQQLPQAVMAAASSDPTGLLMPMGSAQDLGAMGSYQSDLPAGCYGADDTEAAVQQPRRKRHAGARGPSRETVRQYLQVQGQPDAPDQVVTLINARVVQKSYGSEKRFFCPPPCISLSGSRWRDNPNGTVCVFVGMGEAAEDYYHVDLEETDFVGMARNLYISDQDKRKSFYLHLKVFYSNQRDIGTFCSKPVKVISKPSKKKQSSANLDMCIESGSEICLFNRVRAQAGSTRYLCGATDQGFASSTKRWGSFVITKIASPSASGEGAAASASSTPDLIRYGSTVTLTCSTTQQVSCAFVVHRVDKLVVDMLADDPVSQLQKVTLLKAGSDNEFLSLVDDNVVLRKAKPSTKPNRCNVVDGSTWTVSSCDRVEYTFAETVMEPGDVPFPVNPVPIVSCTKALGPRLELYGENFSTNLTVWFDDVPSETLYRCEELMLCTPPSIGQIIGSDDTLVRQERVVQLLLARDDGIIYRTGRTYTYEVDHFALVRERALQSS